MKELIERWQAKSPAFWVKIQQLAISIGTGGIGILTINEAMNLQLDGWIITCVKYAIVAGAAFGLSAKLTKE